MSVEALTRLNHLSILFGRYGQTQGLQLPDSVKQLSSSAGIALAKAVALVQQNTSDSSDIDQGVQSAFVDLGKKFLKYLRDLKQSAKNKGLDKLLSTTLFKFPNLKHTTRDKSNEDATVIAKRLKDYDYTVAHPKILERIKEIHRLLEWYQEGHGKEFLEKEFGIKSDQLANYIFVMLGKAHERYSPRDSIIELASRDVQGTRHDYAGVDKGISNLKQHVKFLKQLEDALQGSDLPPTTRNKLSAIKQYAFSKDASTIAAIAQSHQTSRQSIQAWITRWNERSKGDPKQFFLRDWNEGKTASPRERQEALS